MKDIVTYKNRYGCRMYFNNNFIAYSNAQGLRKIHVNEAIYFNRYERRYHKEIYDYHKFLSFYSL